MKLLSCESMINSPNKGQFNRCVIIESSEVVRKPEIILVLQPTSVQFLYCTLYYP